MSADSFVLERGGVDSVEAVVRGNFGDSDTCSEIRFTGPAMRQDTSKSTAVESLL